MAIIGHVESRSFRGRAIHAAIILALSLGGLSMVYPFAIMISGSLRSDMDLSDFDLVPDYLVDETGIYRKFLETKYNQNAELLNASHLDDYASFRDPAAPPPATEAQRRDVQTLRTRLADPDLPMHWQVLGGIQGNLTVPEHLRQLRRRLMARFDGDLDALGRALGAPVASWHVITLKVPDWLVRRYDYDDSILFQTYLDLLRQSDPAERIPVSLTGLFLQNIVYPRYGSAGLAEFNAAHGTQLASFQDFRLPDQVPGEDQPTLRAEWLEFVHKELNPSFILVHGATQEAYERVQERETGSAAHPLPDGRRWLGGAERQAYERFLDQASPEDLRLVGPEYAWSDLPLFDLLPRMEYDYAQAHRWSLRRTYAARNYRNVFDELVVQGRPLLNTMIYCASAIALALLVNPMAAYAMSRFKLPGTYRVLLILLATMAFPPMVTLIPQFILMRKLDLLNTFPAMLVPFVVDGYMIFLLKGFFDSLPQELYESARIDGAGEARMFFQFTLALSKPILAVLALGTFTSAYTAFLYPLLVAPDQDMWLISVWLFQFQQRANGAAVYASVLIASVPTLIIFLFAQRAIMRGIVVPTEK